LAKKKRSVKHVKHSEKPKEDVIRVKKSYLIYGVAAVVVLIAIIVAATWSPSNTTNYTTNTASSNGALSVTIVTLQECKDNACNPTGINSVTDKLFGDVNYNYVDADSKDGKDLIAKYSLTHVPSFIFDGAVAETTAWKNNPQLAGSFDQVGTNYKLKDAASGASYFIDEGKRAEYQAMLKNYPQANLKALGYTDSKPRLDYFVMAFCPYGNPAEEAANEVYKALGDKVEVVPHYILSTDGTSLQSLHGAQEGSEDIRELCVLQQHDLKTFFDFTIGVNNACNANNADTCWTQVATNMGLDADAISSCESNQKFTIASEQDSMIKQLKTLRQGSLVSPSASPTFLINGESYNGARDAESIKQAMCAQFTNRPAECGKAIANTAAAPVGNC